MRYEEGAKPDLREKIYELPYSASPASHLTVVKRLALAQRLGKESRHQIIWADSFPLGAGYSF